MSFERGLSRFRPGLWFQGTFSKTLLVVAAAPVGFSPQEWSPGRCGAVMVISSEKSGSLEFREAKLEWKIGRSRSRVTGTLTLDFEGATINGRPALTLEGVQQWFSKPFDVVPEAGAVAPIAQAVNHCALLESHWKRTPEFDEMRRSNPSVLRMRRIAKALATLQNDLPVLIEDTRKVIGNKQTEGLTAVMAFFGAVNPLAAGFEKFRQRGAGREVDPWHRIARNLRPLILEALTSAGVKRAGFGKITSPAVQIVKSALAYLEVEASEQAIVEAMRTRTRARKNGKITLAKPQTSRAP